MGNRDDFWGDDGDRVTDGPPGSRTERWAMAGTLLFVAAGLAFWWGWLSSGR